MKKIYLILIIAMLVFSGCKEEEEDSVTDSGVTATSPLIDSATQEQYADDAVAAAGWTQAELTPITSDEAAGYSSNTGGEVTNAIANATSQGSMAAARASMGFLVQISIARNPQITPISQTIDQTVTCSGGGAIYIKGSKEGTDEEEYTATTFMGHEITTSTVAYNATACVNEDGYTIWGQGKMTDYGDNLREGVVTSGELSAGSTWSGTMVINGTGTSKITDGLAVLAPDGTKHRLLSDLDGNMVLTMDGTVQSNDTGDPPVYTPTSSSIRISLIGTFNEFTCRMDKTYPLDANGQLAQDISGDIVCQ